MVWQAEYAEPSLGFYETMSYQTWGFKQMEAVRIGST